MERANAVVERLKSIINEGIPLSYEVKRTYAYSFKEHQDAEGWITSAAHILELIITDPDSAYRRRCTQLLDMTKSASRAGAGRIEQVTQEQVGSMIGILQHLLKDVEAGAIIRIADHIQAVVFDDFLDHAEAYQKEGRKEAGVIVGVVFEDTLRRIAEKHDASDQSVEIIITNLVKKQVITEVKAKRARAAADVRNKATHANWDQFDLRDVHNAIIFTRELIATHLNGKS